MRHHSRFWLDVAEDHSVVVDVGNVFYVEAAGEHTLLRTAGPRPRVDRRSFADVWKVLEPLGFFQVRPEVAVNLAYVTELRKQKEADGWEVKLAPPVPHVLKIADDRIEALRGAFDPG